MRPDGEDDARGDEEHHLARHPHDQAADLLVLPRRQREDRLDRLVEAVERRVVERDQRAQERLRRAHREQQPHPRDVPQPRAQRRGVDYVPPDEQPPGREAQVLRVVHEVVLQREVVPARREVPGPHQCGERGGRRQPVGRDPPERARLALAQQRANQLAPRGPRQPAQHRRRRRAEQDQRRREHDQQLVLHHVHREVVFGQRVEGRLDRQHQHRHAEQVARRAPVRVRAAAVAPDGQPAQIERGQQRRRDQQLRVDVPAFVDGLRLRDALVRRGQRPRQPRDRVDPHRRLPALPVCRAAGPRARRGPRTARAVLAPVEIFAGGAALGRFAVRGCAVRARRVWFALPLLLALGVVAARTRSLADDPPAAARRPARRPRPQPPRRAPRSAGGWLLSRASSTGARRACRTARTTRTPPRWYGSLTRKRGSSTGCG